MPTTCLLPTADLTANCSLPTATRRYFWSIADCVAALKAEGWEVWATDLSQVAVLQNRRVIALLCADKIDNVWPLACPQLCLSPVCTPNSRLLLYIKAYFFPLPLLHSSVRLENSATLHLPFKKMPMPHIKIRIFVLPLHHTSAYSLPLQSSALLDNPHFSFALCPFCRAQYA